MVLKQQASKYLKNYLLLTLKCPILLNKHPEVVVLPDVVSSATTVSQRGFLWFSDSSILLNPDFLFFNYT